MDITDAELEEIAREGRENPLPDDVRLRLYGRIADIFREHGQNIDPSVGAALKAAGTPEHYYIVTLPDLSIVEDAGAFATEFTAYLWGGINLAKYPNYDPDAFAVLKGYNVNGRLVRAGD